MTFATRGGYRGGGWFKRGIAWETVVALRAEWARLMLALGFEGDEWTTVNGKRIAVWLQDESLPTQFDLAAKYGVHPVKAHEIIRGKIYRLPPGEAANARRAHYRATIAARRKVTSV